MRTLTLICLSVLLTNCHDVIEKNISNQVLTLISPADSSQSSQYSILFWWEANEHITKYRVQIARPDFKNIQDLILDTLLTGSKFNFTLAPESYTVRIRGENGASSTVYFYRQFSVDTNTNFTGMNITVESPESGLITNSKIVNFFWRKFPFATSYHFTRSNNGLPVKVLSTSFNYIIDTFENEGIYKWSVFAHNSENNTNTNPSFERTITYDITPPTPSSPFSPANNSVVTNPVTISWSRISEDISYDSIYFSNTSDFSNVVESAKCTNTSYSFSGSSGISYYWKLRTYDFANNKSDSTSITRKFTLN